MKQITSSENPLFKSILRLARSSRARREEGRIVLEGIHLVQAYLERFGAAGMELVVKDSAARHPEIAALISEARVVTFGDTLFDRAAPVQSPVGILAIAPLPQPASPRKAAGFQVLLDGVQDPGNLGAILRSAAAAGGTLAHLSATCADPWSPKALRGGMGAQFLLQMHAHQNLPTVAAAIEASIIACSANGDTSVFECDLKGDIAFIIGGEGAGISVELAACVQQTVRIPMQHGIESLNAGAAAAICFFEWARQSELFRGHY